MKAIFISYNQAYNEEIVEVLEANGQRGYTAWQDIQGRGSETGIPPLGNHAWPEMNHAILTVVEDNKVDGILADLREKDRQYEKLGLRAFVWTVDSAI